MCAYNKKEFRKRRIMFLLFFIAVTFLLAGAVMLLWNAVVPDIFGVKALSYWQAMGILVLARVLTGNMPFRSWRHRGGYPVHPDLREKLMSMSEEEKARFREELKQRCRTRE